MSKQKVNRQTDRQTDRRTDGRRDGRDGRTDGRTVTTMAHSVSQAGQKGVIFENLTRGPLG